jgi:hypothetical protein
MFRPCRFFPLFSYPKIYTCQVTLPVFQKTLTHYRAIQAKVEAEVEKVSQAKSQLAGTMGKVAAKTAIGMAASFIPINT